MALSRKYKYVWVGLLVTFLGVEAAALLDPAFGDTFTEFVWHIIGTGETDRNLLQWVARGGLGILFAWLIPHFFTGWGSLKPRNKK